MKIESCRLCDSKNFRQVIDLGLQPMADTFVTQNQTDQDELFPLQVGLCQDCGHLFTLNYVDPILRYQKADYSYDSANSKVSTNHFMEFCRDIIKNSGITHNSKIVEIGSNVGTLLHNFQNSGFRNIQGVDPSPNISKIANQSGIPTIPDFFNSQVVDKIKISGQADVLIGSNVLNHVEDVNELLQNAKSLLSTNGLLIFEVPYAKNLIQQNIFDTIYHEHVHYFSVRSLALCLSKFDYHIVNLQQIEYMGGSIRVYAKQKTKASQIVAAFIRNEFSAGLFNLETYHGFTELMESEKTRVQKFLQEIKSKNGVAVGIGAAAKANTYLNYCNISCRDLAFITDSSDLKVGKLTPSSRIPILADSSIDSKVTHAILLAWNISELLRQKLSKHQLKFYTPHEEVTYGIS